MKRFKKIIAIVLISIMFITFDSIANVSISQASSNKIKIQTNSNNKIKIVQSKAKNGLKGEYFGNKNLTSLKFTRVDSRINFDWSAGLSGWETIIGQWDVNINNSNSNSYTYGSDEDNEDWSEIYDWYTDAKQWNDQVTNQFENRGLLKTPSFSVRWSGQISPEYSEIYTFHTIADDGVRLWVDNQLIVDQWYDSAATEYKGSIYLEANKKYNIKMEYYQNKDDTCAKLLWSSKSQVKEIIPQDRLYPEISTAQGPVTNGNGLKGEYFDNMNLTDLGLTRIDPAINMDWGKGSPDSSIGPNTFSVRWTGRIMPNYSETYTFYITADDGARLWVNNSLIIDCWNTGGASEKSGSITLTKGTKYDIRLEYYENQDLASVKLKWSSYSQNKDIVPQANLFY